MPNGKVFISYSSQDRAAAEAVHAALSGHFEVWRDQARIETDWSREVAHALAGADAVCLLWSAHAAQSKWVKHEWLTARALEKPIVPCLFPGAESLPAPLYNLHGIPFGEGAECKNRLIGQIGKSMGAPVAYDYKILPPKSYVPFNPNPHFTGRHADLLDLYLKMIGNLNKIGINQVGTVGMGGIGKTQLAVEFACRFGFGFPAVYWVQGSDPAAWLPEFVSIARDRLQLPVKDPDKPQAARQYVYALQEHFKERPGTLVVMDNVVEPRLLNNDGYLGGLTPLSLGCDLLFTTRRHFQLPGVAQQPVNVLSPAAAYGLMSSFCAPRTAADEDHARSICNAVGYLPLAVTLAGSYLKQYQPDVSFADYREELAKNRLGVIDVGGMTEEELATRHVAAVGATLRSQWEMLPDEDARRLFKVAGQFPEAAIVPKARLGLLAGIRPGESKVDRPLARAFNWLHCLSLAESLGSDGGAARLHPLVREFSLQLVPEEERAAFRRAAARSLKEAHFDYAKLESDIRSRGIRQVLDDLKVALDWWGKDGDEKRDLELLEWALRLSAHVLAVAPDQLPAQLLGRLLDQKSPRIAFFLEQLTRAQRKPWLRPLTRSLTAPGGPLIRTLAGHTDSVMAVALTPDGRRVVSGSRDKILKIWDIETGTELKTLSGHTKMISVVAVTPDGRCAVSGSYDNTLKVWDLETGLELKTIFDQDSLSVDQISLVVVTPDSRRAISGHYRTHLKVWDLETGAKLKTLFIMEGFRYIEYSVLVVTPDGRLAIFGPDGYQLKVRDLETGADLKPLNGYTGEIVRMAVTPDGRRVVSGSDDGTLCSWDLETGVLLKKFSAHKGSVDLLVVTPDGRRAISGVANDRTWKFWDLEAGECLKALTGHTDRVHAVAVTSDGRLAVSGSNDKTLKVWNLEDSANLVTLTGHTEEVNSVALTPDGRRAVSGSGDNSLKVWDVETGAVLKTLTGHEYWVSAVAVTSDGRRAVSGEGYNTLKVWDLETGVLLKTLGPYGRIYAVAVTSDRRWAISGSDQLGVWDLETGALLKTLSGHHASVIAVAVKSDRRWAVSGSHDATLKVWNLETGALLMTLSGHTESIYAVAVTPDGRRAVSGSGDNTLKIWDLEAGVEQQTLSGHTDCVSSVAVTPDGMLAISGSKDNTIIVWNIVTGKSVTTFYGDGIIRGVQFTPDKKTIVAGDSSGAVHFLRLENAD